MIDVVHGSRRHKSHSMGWVGASNWVAKVASVGERDHFSVNWLLWGSHDPTRCEMRMSRPSMTLSALSLLLFLGSATALLAQERRNWTVTAVGGQFYYDFADENFPMAAVRFDRPLSKWVRFEFEGSLARVEVQSDPSGAFDPNLPELKSSLGTVSIGFQLRHRTERVEPYVGFGFGLFKRRDDQSEDEGQSVRSSQSTLVFPGGLRIFLTDQLGLRAEVRMRRDQTAFGVSSETNWEKTLGISWTFGG